MLSRDIKKLIHQNYSPLLNLGEENVDHYVEKIVVNAIVVPHYEKGYLRGIVAFYPKDKVTGASFATMCLVDKSFRGKGIGKYLLEYWINYARKSGCCSVVCEANIDNVVSLNLLKSLGLEAVSRSKSKMKVVKIL